MGDQNLMGLYFASKVLNIDLFDMHNKDKRIYSFDGEIIYDFKRKSFARVFPVGNNEYKIFDYALGNYLVVSRNGNHFGMYRL